MTLDELTESLKKNQYTQLTQDEINKQAQTRYDSVYNQKKLSEQQAYEKSDLALSQQASTLGTAYDKQRKQAQESYASAYSQADRQALSRGMQRSSYNNQTLSNINLKGAEALQGVSEDETNAKSNIAAQRAQLTQQLSQKLAAYDDDKLSDTLAYADELSAREYDRGASADSAYNQLMQSLYQFGVQDEQNKLSAEQWQKQFEESIRQYETSLTEEQRQFDKLHPIKKTGGSGTKTTTTPSTPTGSITGTPMSQEDFYASLQGKGYDESKASDTLKNILNTAQKSTLIPTTKSVDIPLNMSDPLKDYLSRHPLTK